MPPMRNALGPGTVLGYCTNVHAGVTLDEVRANLERHAVPVKARVSPSQPMGVGLWLSAKAAAALVDGPDSRRDQRIARFRDWLDQRGLFVFTLNGFPYGDFHQPIVKHAVYRPDWSDPRRARYTLHLAQILARLLPDDLGEGSISSLPLGWGREMEPGWADLLCQTVNDLAAIEDQTGKCIHLDIEPEPGCMVEDAPTAFGLFESIAPAGQDDPEVIRRHLRLCLDVCHAAVMFEKPTLMLERARESGYLIGKVQVSSAVRAPLGPRGDADYVRRLHALSGFVEPRYLHQTNLGNPRSGRIRRRYDDLPDALSADDLPQTPGKSVEWRVHFHVPIHLPSIPPLGTTQDHIPKLMKAIQPDDHIRHFEVETYAWNVLPDHLRPAELSDGIAAEMQWLLERFGA